MNQFCYVIIFLVVGGFDNLLFHLIDVHTGVWAAMHGWWNALVIESQLRIWVGAGSWPGLSSPPIMLHLLTCKEIILFGEVVLHWCTFIWFCYSPVTQTKLHVHNLPVALLDMIEGNSGMSSLSSKHNIYFLCATFCLPKFIWPLSVIWFVDDVSIVLKFSCQISFSSKYVVFFLTRARHFVFLGLLVLCNNLNRGRY